MSKNVGLKVIVGLGATGLSCARYLLKQKIPVAIVDSRDNPPQWEALQKEYPEIDVSCGGFPQKILDAADEIVVSPGVSLKEPAIAQQIENGKPVVGDIELFARRIKKPVLAITGSNGKTTVTTLLGLMMESAGLRASVCGNIGEPVLEQLTDNEPDYYVIELSSFQLETTYSLAPKAATVLNVSPDHMDRYADYQAYLQAKQRIYQHCVSPVVNADQPDVWRDLNLTAPLVQYSVRNPRADFSLIERDRCLYLAHNGSALIAVHELKLKARHHLQNALAALAMGYMAELPIDSMLDVLQRFAGLPHRCQWIRNYNNVDWYNDSKGTNVGATQAAIESVGSQIAGDLILIAGGQGKGAQFSSLRQVVSRYVKHIVLIGEDAPVIESALKGAAQISNARSMEAAVVLAAKVAESGDSVLLSPACASFDMFDHFEHRGDVYTQAVEAL